MSMELITLIGIGVALATLILNTQRNLRADMRTEFKAVRAEMQAQREEIKTEFKTQREAIISLLERMAHLEGLLEGLREAITGRRVAEEAGKYDPR